MDISKLKQEEESIEANLKNSSENPDREISLLRSLVINLKAQNEILSASDCKKPNEIEQTEESVDEVDSPFLIPTTTFEKFIPITTIDNSKEGFNMLCIRPHPFFPDLVAIGGVNKCVVIYHATLKSGNQELGRIRFTAPVLSMDFSPFHRGGLLVAGLMDGSTQVMSMDAKGSEEFHGIGNEAIEKRLNTLPVDLSEGISLQSSDVIHLKHSFKDHAKYVVRCKFSQEGDYFATASHDKTVALYKINYSDFNQSFQFEKLTKLFLPEAVESVEFVGGAPSNEKRQLVIACREQCFLTYINLESENFENTHVSINENVWDKHVSFTIMHLEASPDKRYILAATDKARIIVYRVGKSSHIRTMVGHNSDAYFQPRATWTHDSKLIFTNSMGTPGLLAYCSASSRKLQWEGSHTGVIRDIFCHHKSRMLYTAAYDKTAKIFSYR